MVSQVTCYLLILYWYSRCYSHTERSNRSKLCKRRANLHAVECTRLGRHSDKQTMNVSCRDCVFCPVCKGNKILCCRFNTNNSNQYTFIILTLTVDLDSNY